MATLQNTTFTTSSTTVNVTVPTTGTGLAFDKAGYFTATALTSGTSPRYSPTSPNSCGAFPRLGRARSGAGR